MKNEPLSDLILDVREHEAVRDLATRSARTKSDLRKMEALLQEHTNRISELRRDLVAMDMDVAIGKPVDPAARAYARRQLEEAQANRDMVSEEIERRRKVHAGNGEVMAAAIKQAGREATELLQPVVRSLTQRYLDGLAAANEAALELHQIYSAIARSDSRNYSKHNIRQGINPPHANPVFAPGQTSTEEFLKRTADHIRTIRGYGYTIEDPARV